jgi:hypothetical protein
VFSGEEELASREFIIANFISPGLFFTDSDFRLLAMQLHPEKYHDLDPRGFVCSKGHIYDCRV